MWKLVDDTLFRDYRGSGLAFLVFSGGSTRFLDALLGFSLSVSGAFSLRTRGGLSRGLPLYVERRPGWDHVLPSLFQCIACALNTVPLWVDSVTTGGLTITFRDLSYKNLLPRAGGVNASMSTGTGRGETTMCTEISIP